MKRGEIEALVAEARVENRHAMADAIQFLSRRLEEVEAERDKAQTELKRWQSSFDGHVYVKNEDYASLAAKARERDVAIARLKSAEESLEGWESYRECEKQRLAAAFAKGAEAGIGAAANWHDAEAERIRKMPQWGEHEAIYIEAVDAHEEFATQICALPLPAPDSKGEGG